MTDIPNLILASASPRRHQLLRNVACDFTIEVADTDETHMSGESPNDYVRRVAAAKAHKVLLKNRDAAVLAADTIVTLGGTIFGKPRHQEHAFEMWRQLSDAEHQVVTAIHLGIGDQDHTDVVTTTVRFAALSERQMERYWQCGEPQDKAGGYAIQGFASAWVKEVHGSYSNVVGLPLFETNQLLTTIGHNWL